MAYKKIIDIRASLNLGLSDLQKSEFPNYQPVERKLIQATNIIDPQWVAGFISGEGSFVVNISKSKSHKIGSQVKLIFTVVQHERDKNLIELLKKYLGCGKVYKKSNLSVVELRIVKLNDIKKILIPLFEKNSIQGIKQLDFQDFCKITNLMIEGAHLTKNGLEKIRIIKSKMNTHRKINSN